VLVTLEALVTQLGVTISFGSLVAEQSVSWEKPFALAEGVFTTFSKTFP